jgi:hypothetical protein
MLWSVLNIKACFMIPSVRECVSIVMTACALIAGNIQLVADLIPLGKYEVSANLIASRDEYLHDIVFAKKRHCLVVHSEIAEGPSAGIVTHQATQSSTKRFIVYGIVTA